MNKWTCGHTAHGTCSRCNSTLAWKAHLLLEVADNAVAILDGHDKGAAAKLRAQLNAAINYKGES